jgi:hypothetical protein
VKKDQFNLIYPTAIYTSRAVRTTKALSTLENLFAPTLFCSQQPSPSFILSIMRYSSILAVLAVACVEAAPAPEPHLGGLIKGIDGRIRLPFSNKIVDEQSQQAYKRGLIQELSGIFGKKSGKATATSAAPGLVPEVQIEKAVMPGATRKKIRYGSYKVPATPAGGQKLLAESGGLLNTATLSMTMPCTDCTVLTFQAGLEYADGSNANVDTGAWLHHMVMVNRGKNRKDTTCGFPFMRFFSSGNERTVTGFQQLANGTIVGSKEKSGFYMAPGDKFSMELELMVSSR